MKKKSVNLAFDKEEYETIVRAAEKDYRPVASYIKMAALKEAKKKDMAK